MSYPSARTPFVSIDSAGREARELPPEAPKPARVARFDLVALAWLATLPMSAVTVFFLLQDSLRLLGDLAR